MERIAVVGTSGHAKVVIDIIENSPGQAVAGVIADNLDGGTSFAGYRVLGNDDDVGQLWRSGSLDSYIVAIGDNALRGRVAEMYQDQHPEIPVSRALHPDAVIADSADISAGTVIMAGAIVNPSCVIGRGCIINTRASLDHDCVLEEFASLAPGSVTGGNCTIGRFSAVGIGAKLKHGVSIGENTIIGAGATVIRDIAPFKVAYGTPATERKDRKAGDPYL